MLSSVSRQKTADCVMARLGEKLEKMPALVHMAQLAKPKPALWPERWKRAME